MTAAELRKAEAAYRAASGRAEEKRTERNRLIRDATGQGWTHAQIAEALGVTRSRAGQLAQAASTSRPSS